jgi:hypothetical protein
MSSRRGGDDRSRRRRWPHHVPKSVDWYMDEKNQIYEAFDLMHEGSSIQTGSSSRRIRGER